MTVAVLVSTMTARQVEREVLRLSELATPEARKTWKDLTGNEPGRGLKGDLLARTLAHAFQEKTLGGLSEGFSRRLAVIVREAERDRATPTTVNQEKPIAPERRRIMPGCRLVREWQGDLHEVTVIAGGFCWRGRTFTSLSTIAREITGTNWNGWTFFGISRERRKAAIQAERTNA